MSEPSNHHFVPQFYLRKFSQGLGRQSRIFAFDTINKKAITTATRNVASKRDFNRIEVEGEDPNSVEKALSQMEGAIASHLNDVIETKSFPTQKHYISIVNLISHVCHRNPKSRKIVDGWHSKMSKASLEIMANNPHLFQEEIERLREEGHDVDTTAEEMRDFVKSGKYEIRQDQTYLIGLELEIVQDIIECTLQRNWRFFVAPDDNQFITSDNPVVLIWSNYAETSLVPPGYALTQTTLIFPISPKILLVGTYEEANGVFCLTKDEVSGINSMLLYSCHRQIYAKDSCFEVGVKNAGNISGSELESRFSSM